MMSSVRMAADSTQHVRDDKTAQKRKTTKDPHSHKTKKLKKGSSKTLKKRKRGDDESECESDLDLEKPLTAIGSYIKNRHETVEHMFRSISQVKLRGMLPDILKPIPIEELKALSVSQLEMMSRKRIRRILDGDDPDAISSSGTDDESTDSEQEEGVDPPQHTGVVQAGIQADIHQQTDEVADLEPVTVQYEDDLPCGQEYVKSPEAEITEPVTDHEDDVTDEPHTPYREQSPVSADSDTGDDTEYDTDTEADTQSEAESQSEPEEGELVEEKPKRRRRKRQKPAPVVSTADDDITDKADTADTSIHPDPEQQADTADTSIHTDPDLQADTSIHTDPDQQEDPDVQEEPSGETEHAKCEMSDDEITEPPGESAGDAAGSAADVVVDAISDDDTADRLEQDEDLVTSQSDDLKESVDCQEKTAGSECEEEKSNVNCEEKTTTVDCEDNLELVVDIIVPHDETKVVEFNEGDREEDKHCQTTEKQPDMSGNIERYPVEACPPDKDEDNASNIINAVNVISSQKRKSTEIACDESSHSRERGEGKKKRRTKSKKHSGRSERATSTSTSEQSTRPHLDASSEVSPAKTAQQPPTSIADHVAAVVKKAREARRLSSQAGVDSKAEVEPVAVVNIESDVEPPSKKTEQSPTCIADHVAAVVKKARRKSRRSGSKGKDGSKADVKHVAESKTEAAVDPCVENQPKSKDTCKAVAEVPAEIKSEVKSKCEVKSKDSGKSKAVAESGAKAQSSKVEIKIQDKTMPKNNTNSKTEAESGNQVNTEASSAGQAASKINEGSTADIKCKEEVKSKAVVTTKADDGLQDVTKSMPSEQTDANSTVRVKCEHDVKSTTVVKSESGGKTKAENNNQGGIVSKPKVKVQSGTDDISRAPSNQKEVIKKHSNTREGSSKIRTEVKGKSNVHQQIAKIITDNIIVHQKQTNPGPRKITLSSKKSNSNDATLIEDFKCSVPVSETSQTTDGVSVTAQNPTTQTRRSQSTVIAEEPSVRCAAETKKVVCLPGEVSRRTITVTPGPVVTSQLKAVAKNADVKSTDTDKVNKPQSKINTSENTKSASKVIEKRDITKIDPTKVCNVSHGAVSEGGDKKDVRRTVKLSRPPPTAATGTSTGAGTGTGSLSSGEPHRKDSVINTEESDDKKKAKAKLSSNQMEILELEMRARAIKAMLKSQTS